MDDDLTLDEWGAKTYGRTPFGINWPANTFWGAGLNLRIAALRMYVHVIYLPLIRPVLKRLVP